MTFYFNILLYFFLLISLTIQFKSKEIEKQIKKIRKLQDLSDDIAIVHINDVHCGLNDSIGYDGFVLYRNELKKKYKYVISVDVGDHVQGGTLGSLSEGMAMIKIMNKIGFDVAILGNHEFDYGIDQLFKFKENLTSKYICSNFYYRKNHTRVFNASKIIDCGGKKIGFIGVVTPLTLSITFLSTVKDENGELVYDFLSEKDVLYNDIQQAIDEIKGNVDYIILLTHLGMSLEKYTSEDLLSNLTGVTAVLDAHTHKVYNVTSKDKEEKEIHITQTGTKLEAIGTLILKEDGSITSETISEVPEPSDKTNATTIFRSKKNRWVDTEMKEYLDSIWAEYKDELNIIVGNCSFDFIIRPENETDSKYIFCRYKECTLGNLISDAIRDAGKTDITILNGGCIRNNMKNGTLSRARIIEVLPWFGNLVVKEITGQDILDALEFGVSKLPSSSAGFPQVSGITFDVDTTINSSVLTDSTGMFLNVTGKRRVSNVKINGEDLNLTKKYNATLREYLSTGGDGYSMFGKYDVTKDCLISETDQLSAYIGNALKGEIPEEYKDLQGRININKKDDSTDSINNDDNINNETIYQINNNFKRKNSRKLSAGGIVAIVLSCVAVLIIVTALIFLLKSKTPHPENESRHMINYVSQ